MKNGVLRIKRIKKIKSIKRIKSLKGIKRIKINTCMNMYIVQNVCKYD